MKYEGLLDAVKISRAYKRKKLRLRIVSGLAAVVIFITTYALILPAATKERPTFCGYTEHIHNEECVLDGCNLTEHTHTDSCYINVTTDFETSDDWESTLPKQLSGKWREDIIAVAESQLGYRESSINVATADEATADELAKGYTRYGEWYGEPYGDWASMFANFCLTYAGVDDNYFPYCADNEKWVEKLSEKELFAETPNVGDIIFFRKGNKVDLKKVGIVAKLIYDGDKLVRIKTIEGDSGDRVCYNEYSVSEEKIFGYGNLGAGYDEFKKYQPIVKYYSNDDVSVRATLMPSAGIPDSAELVVKVIDRETSPEEFDKRFDEAFEKIDNNANSQIKYTQITGFRLYDIHFLYNGAEIQPQASVDIQISYRVTSYSKTADISVVHYAKDGAELPESEHKVDGSGNLVTDFETESFSLFAIVTSETITENVISLSKYNVSSNSVARNLGGKTFAIINSTFSSNISYALNVNGTSLSSKKVELQGDSTLTAHENSVRWLFEKTGSSYSYTYYISTTIDGTKYYLSLSNGALSLVQSSGTVFTVSRSSGNITLSASSRYVRIDQNGASAGSSQTLSLYQAPTGNYTATFDGQIGNATYMGSSNKKYSNATVIKKTATNGYVTLPTVEEALKTEPGNYPLTLNGWYDIINSVYYDSSMFGKEIKLTNNTTFYPEWVAKTYDIGQNKNVIEGQADTSGFITTHVFDYNELFNVHSAIYDEADSRWEFDPNSELGFIFFDYIQPTGNIGYIYDKDASVNGVTVNAEKTNGTRGSSTNFPGTITPGIATDARLDALFGDDPIVGRVALGEGDWLYNFDPSTGYYYYNSACNAASYNQSEQRFYIYNHTVNIKTPSNNSINDFLPLNYGDPDDYADGKVQFAEKDNEANYWFGMKSEITFYLPDDSGSGKNIAANGKDDMQFRFSGDDDVWIFVDDQLVLDLGGVHDMVYGEINFSTGKVKTGQAISSSAIADNSATTHKEMPGLTGTAGITTTDLPTLKGGEEHKLTVYYLERGSSLSNCAVYFNLSPLYKLQLTKRDSDGGDLLAGATFKVFSDKDCTTPAVLYNKLADGSMQKIDDSTFTTDENGIATCWGLFAGKTYYIKEIEAPEGYPDMSDYVIEFSLSEDGESVFVMIDSKGSEWEFAGKYHYVGGEDHLIELDIYNHEYIGGDEELYVEKVWADGSENLPSEIKVWLYANGNKTSRYIILSAEEGWKGKFLELPKYDVNNQEIVYSVEEEKIDGFAATYESITYTETDSSDIPGWRITNTPKKSKTNIPVEKIWDDSVPNADRQDVVVKLYLVTVGDEDDPLFIDTLTLSSVDDWKGSFSNIPIPDEGSYYVIVEAEDNYTVAYSGNTVSVKINNLAKTAARVEIDDDGNAILLEITNSVLVVLPETGGFGNWIYLVVGALLIIASAVLVIKFRKKIRI